MPNGYSQAPYIFTKILKVPFAYLRKNGHSSVVYIDDTYLQGDSPEDCERNIHNTATLLWDLGFSIHPDKSVLLPTQKLEFLGFVLDSKAFIIFLTEKRKQKILTMCQEALNSPCQQIKATASLVGCLIAALPGVKYGALFYRRLEHCKNNSLKLHKGNYKKKSMLTEDALEDVKWWATNVNAVTNFIYPPPVTLTLYADASLEGLGGTDTTSEIGGRWSDHEMPAHINVLELLVAKFVLQSFTHALSDCHIKLMLDNMTAVCYVNKMGGPHSLPCNIVAREIWLWAKERNLWLSANHIAGSANFVADFKSRIFKDNTEWQLSPKIFQRVTNTFFRPEYDLFASRLNTQVSKYASWYPEPGSWIVDAFSISW